MALYTPIPSWAADEPPELTNASVLHRDIAWDTYVNARLISEKDLRNIRLYDKKPAATREEILKTVGHTIGTPMQNKLAPHTPHSPLSTTQEGPAIVASLLVVLKNVTKEDTVQYVLALFKEMLATDRTYALLFFPDPNSLEAYNVFLRYVCMLWGMGACGGWQQQHAGWHCCWNNTQPHSNATPHSLLTHTHQVAAAHRLVYTRKGVRDLYNPPRCTSQQKRITAPGPITAGCFWIPGGICCGICCCARGWS